MSQVSSFPRAPEPGRYVAFEPGADLSDGVPNDAPGAPDFAAIRAHPDFLALRRRLARFIFPVTALFLAWYLTYVLLAAYAHDFMSIRVFGSVTMGLLLGLSQFGTTVGIMLWYARFARTKVDPEVAALRRMAGEDDDDR